MTFFPHKQMEISSLFFLDLGQWLSNKRDRPNSYSWTSNVANHTQHLQALWKSVEFEVTQDLSALSTHGTNHAPDIHLGTGFQTFHPQETIWHLSFFFLRTGLRALQPQCSGSPCRALSTPVAFSPTVTDGQPLVLLGPGKLRWQCPWFPHKQHKTLLLRENSASWFFWPKWVQAKISVTPDLSKPSNWAKNPKKKL